MNSNNAQFQQLLAKLAERECMVPDELVQYYCSVNGGELTDVRAARLVGLAAQRFITNVLKQTIHLSRARDRLPFSRLKDQGFNPKDKTRVLLTEELVRSLKQFGIHADHVPYFVRSAESPGN